MSSQNSHNIDFEVKGNDIQFVEVTLDPGEEVVSEPSSMMYFDQGIQMSTRMGDGSEKNSGLFGTIAGAAKRMLTGETIFLNFYSNKAKTRLRCAFSGAYPGQISAINLKENNGSIYCQRGSFLCAAKGTSLGVGFTKKLGAGFFGGEGFILQKVEGDGMCFIHAGGSIEEITLAPNQVIYIDTGSLVAFSKGIDFDIETISGVRNILFSGENLFLSKLKGPGKVWIQSMPYGRILSQIQQQVVTYINENRK
jgi:uncharacterized protein (TIGR00266 family)